MVAGGIGVQLQTAAVQGEGCVGVRWVGWVGRVNGLPSYAADGSGRGLHRCMWWEGLELY